MNAFEQGLLRYLSADQLNTIQFKRIAIGGAGGLGSNIAIILVRSGFKNLEIIDSDIIDPSNLNRQQYFIHEIGKPKVEVLKRRLLDINPDLRLTVYQNQWSPIMADRLFKDSDFFIEAFDKTEWKHKFVDYYGQKNKPVISGNGMAGLIEKKPMTVKKVGNIYFVGDRTTDASQGHPPMAPRVTACAAMMAEIVLDLTLASSTPPQPPTVSQPKENKLNYTQR